MVRMLRLTDALIWEDLPSTDPVTGSLTMAAWIPRIQKFTTIITATAIAFHVVQSTIRFTTSDDRPFMFVTWYPFDVTKSPTYELINITQVKGFIIRWMCNVLIYLCDCNANSTIKILSPIHIGSTFVTVQWLGFEIRNRFGVGIFI